MKRHLAIFSRVGQEQRFLFFFYMHLKFKKVSSSWLTMVTSKLDIIPGSYFIKKKRSTGRGLPTSILPAPIGSASTPTRPPVQLSLRSRLMRFCWQQSALSCGSGRCAKLWDDFRKIIEGGYECGDVSNTQRLCYIRTPNSSRSNREIHWTANISSLQIWSIFHVYASKAFSSCMNLGDFTKLYWRRFNLVSAA
jgi:hypothetical protein